mmetsp:Transcript_18246/g.46040  ORF Transcript_18246/g.46040 Transcript_18246/m.46040 type:complete len:206 (+) Transcript_18246:169-786(+)
MGSDQTRCCPLTSVVLAAPAIPDLVPPPTPAALLVAVSGRTLPQLVRSWPQHASIGWSRFLHACLLQTLLHTCSKAAQPRCRGIWSASLGPLCTLSPQLLPPTNPKYNMKRTLTDRPARPGRVKGVGGMRRRRRMHCGLSLMFHSLARLIPPATSGINRATSTLTPSDPNPPLPEAQLPATRLPPRQAKQGVAQTSHTPSTPHLK